MAILGWLCLHSTLADAISNCYGEKPCWCFIVSGCLWRVGKERAVCAWSSVVTMCSVELGHSKRGEIWLGSRLPAKGRRKVKRGNRNSEAEFLITVLALRAG